MSKSLGNFLTIDGLLKEAPGEVIRYQLLMVHYRQPLDWTAAMTAQAKQALIKFSKALRSLPAGALGVDTGLYPPFVEALEDDLNTPEAIAALHALEEEIRGVPEGLVKERLAGSPSTRSRFSGLRASRTSRSGSTHRRKSASQSTKPWSGNA